MVVEKVKAENTMSAETLWRCQCRICRLMVHPILSRLKIVRSTKLEQFELPSEIEEMPEEETMKETAEEKGSDLEKYLKIAKEVPLPQPQQVGKEVQEQTERRETESSKETSKEPEAKDKGQDETKAQVTLPPDMTQRVEKLENDVNKIKSYVKASIDAIKATLVDLRAAVAEVSNPFNLLRKYSELMFGEEGKKHTMQRMPLPNQLMQHSMQQSYTYSTPMTPSPPHDKPKQPTALSIPSSIIKDRDRISKDKEKKSATISPSRLEKVIIWAYNVLSKYGYDKLKKIIEYYTEIEVIDQETSDYLLKIIDAVKKLMDEGLNVKSQIATAHVLSKISENIKSSVKESKEIKEIEGAESEEKPKSDVNELLKIIDSELQGEK